MPTFVTPTAQLPDLNSKRSGLHDFEGTVDTGTCYDPWGPKDNLFSSIININDDAEDEPRTANGRRASSTGKGVIIFGLESHEAKTCKGFHDVRLSRVDQVNDRVRLLRLDLVNGPVKVRSRHPPRHSLNVRLMQMCSSYQANG